MAVILALATVANANLIPLGSVTFTGDFTLNHLYDFNSPASQPFGWWSDQTVTRSTDIFVPDVQAGNVLDGPGLWTSQQPSAVHVGRVHIRNDECGHIRR